MNKDAMNQGVQILLDRMDTNPEEFEYDIAMGGGKWSDIVQAVHARKNAPEAHKNTAPLPFLTDPEVNALYEKLEDVRRENFTADVLRRLADDSQTIKQQELWANVSTYSTSNYPVLGTPPSLTTGTGTGTWGGSSITTAQSLSLSEREKQQLCEALEDYKLKQHKDLHKAYALAVKAEAVKAERKKAVK
jgi:hypothetical protein